MTVARRLWLLSIPACIDTDNAMQETSKTTSTKSEKQKEQQTFYTVIECLLNRHIKFVKVFTYISVTGTLKNKKKVEQLERL